MKNLLYLHEAIAVALINLDKDNFTSTYQEIADYIEERNLYPERIYLNALYNGASSHCIDIITGERTRNNYDRYRELRCLIASCQ